MRRTDAAGDPNKTQRLNFTPLLQHAVDVVESKRERRRNRATAPIKNIKIIIVLVVISQLVYAPRVPKRAAALLVAAAPPHHTNRARLCAQRCLNAETMVRVVAGGCWEKKDRRCSRTQSHATLSIVAVSRLSSYPLSLKPSQLTYCSLPIAHPLLIITIYPLSRLNFKVAYIEITYEEALKMTLSKLQCLLSPLRLHLMLR